MPNHLLLFDIDATLLKTGGAGMNAMKLVAQRLFGAGFRWDGIVTSGSLDPVIFAEAAAINGIENNHDNHSRFRDHYIAELERQIAASMHQFEVLPGVHELLALLRARAVEKQDIAMGLLTGNYTAAVPIKFKAARIDPAWFEITAFGDEGPTRPDLVPVAMRKFHARHGRHVEPRRIVVIGDTPRDVHCAKAHGCTAFAVTTGHYDAATLRAAGADVVVDDLADPAPLLKIVDRL